MPISLIEALWKSTKVMWSNLHPLVHFDGYFLFYLVRSIFSISKSLLIFYLFNELFLRATSVIEWLFDRVWSMSTFKCVVHSSKDQEKKKRSRNPLNDINILKWHTERTNGTGNKLQNMELTKHSISITIQLVPQWFDVSTSNALSQNHCDQFEWAHNARCTNSHCCHLHVEKEISFL